MAFMKIIALILLVTFSSGFISQSEFIENKGQLNGFDGTNKNEIKFYKKGDGMDVCFTEKGVTYFFHQSDFPLQNSFESNEKEEAYNEKLKADSTFYYRLDMNFKNSNPAFEIRSEDVDDFYYNFYFPHCENGLLNVPASEKIIYHNVYDNIDFEFYFSEGQLKYDIVLNPNASIDDIKLYFEGANDIKLVNNELIIQSPVGEIKEVLPKSYTVSKGQTIDQEVSYKLKNGVVQFELDYDNSNKLVIDPQITWSTYYDIRNTVNRGQDVRNNSFVITSQAYSTHTVPTLTPGGSGYFQNSNSGLNDMVILKFDTSGVRQWCTYYGGSEYDYGYDVSILSNNHIVVAGSSRSTDIPKQNPGGGAYYDGTYTQGNGPFNAGGYNYYATFLIRFNAAGVRSWATHYDFLEYPKIEVDNNDNIYVVGGSEYDSPAVQSSGSAYYQSTVAQQGQISNPSANNGSDDMFILKFNSSNQRLWATNLGGDSDDRMLDFKIDANNSLCILGIGDNYSGTNAGMISHNPGGGAYFDNSLGTGYGGSSTDRMDLLLYKFSSAGVMQWGTAFGGDLNEYNGHGAIEFDNNNNIVILGGTRSTNLPLVDLGSGAHYDNTINATGSSYSYFLARFNTSYQLVWSTYYYGNTFSGNFPTYLDYTTDNRMLLGLTAHAADYPIVTSPGSYTQSFLGGGRDIHIAEFAPNMSINWATYLGCAQNDVISGLDLTSSPSYSMFITGHDGYDNIYPLVNPGGGAYYDNVGYNGTLYSFYITKMASFTCDVADNTTSATAVCEGTNIKTLSGSPSGGTWAVVSGGGSISGSNYTSANVTSNTTVIVSYSIAASGGCPATSDNVSFVVNAATNAAAGIDKTVCASTGTATMTATAASVGSGVWTKVSGPAGGAITTPTSATTGITGLTNAGTYVYQWTVTNSPCPATNDQVSIVVSAVPTTADAGTDINVCVGTGTATMAGNAATVGSGLWTKVSGPTGGTITTPTSATTGITGLSTVGTYVYQWTISNSPCTASSDQVSIIVGDVPNAPAAPTGMTPICNGSSSTYSVAAVTGATSYTWSYSGTGSISGTTASESFAPTTGGDLTVIATNACGNSSASNPLEIGVTPLEDSVFTYPATTFCLTGADPVATITGVPGGTFTINNGGTIDAGTGEIDLDANGLQTYIVTYTTPGTCPGIENVSVEVTSSPSATFSYTGTPYCGGTGTAAVTFGAGGSAGVFAPIPATTALVINPTTGAVDLNASTPGTYTVENNIIASGGCAASYATSDITITAQEDATYTYGSTSFCENASNPTATITGTIGGAFTATPAGITVDGSTGEIDLSSSTYGATYIVRYITPGTCSDTLDIDITLSASPTAPTVSTDAGSNTICVGESLNITVTGGSVNDSVYTTAVGGISIGVAPLSVSPTTTTAYYVESFNSNDCGNVGGRQSVLVTVNPLPTISAGSDETICPTDNVTLTATGTGSVVWSTTETTASITVTPAVTTTYTVTLTDANTCENSDDVIVTVITNGGTLIGVDDAFTAETDELINMDVLLNDTYGGNTSTIIIIPNNGTATATVNGSIDYQSAPGFIGIDSLTYEICDMTCATICDTATVIITVEKTIDFSVPGGFSPNDDNVNDIFVIQGLEEYPNNSLSIFNRWGSIIYQAVPYNNDWDGSATEGTVLMGSKVTTGTYFYILDLGEGSEPLRGSIEIKRD